MTVDTIFISVASYQDDMLKLTLQDALAKAIHPDRIKFGVVEQREHARRINPDQYARKHIRYVGVEPEDSRGVGWARAVGMSLYKNETWYFQLDSHMLFDLGWDEWFINKAIELEEQYSKPVISGYPKNFVFEQNAPVRQNEVGTRVHILQENSKFTDNALLLTGQAKTYPLQTPVKAWHAAAGCLFTRGEFVNEIPYDPQIYFQGEEQTLALRAFTHGWDVFHLPDMPIYHYWSRDKRTAHWDCKADKKRHDNWELLQINSFARIRRVLSGKQSGVYGLGTQRTLKEYAEFCGVDYENETLDVNKYMATLPKE